MKPRPFTYLRPASLEEALQALGRHREDARIIAGGLSLVPMMNFRLIETKALIDISGLASLAFIREDGGDIEIGAATTQSDVLAWPQLAARVPLLAAAMPHIGHFQTRSRGTVCGSIAHSDPSSELPLCLATLGGSVVLQSARGRRVLPAREFQTGMLATARQPDEMITAVRFPTRKPGAGYAFTETANRHGDFAICAVAAVVSGKTVRLGVGGVAERPTVLDWPELPEGEIEDALNDFAWELGGSDDLHATASYRRELVRRLGRQVIREAARCSN
ncbi:MAG: FAD binding domain-containing protein [Hyphomicrobiales bacterium]|nr:FAD binding domain-containing protein [Hyphomicrobiales bacterium]